MVLKNIQNKVVAIKQTEFFLKIFGWNRISKHEIMSKHRSKSKAIERI